MLTPDQVQLRLEQAMRTHHEESCWLVLELLHELLPELVAPAIQPHRPESRQSDTKRYGGGVPGRMWQERD